MLRRWRRDEVCFEKFVRIRLKDDNKHKSLIQGFSSKRNPGLAIYLQRNAWFEDNSNYRAYYLIRDGEKIVLYYSLQCGLLFKSHRKLLSGISHKENEGSIEYFVNEDKINVTKVIPAIELAHFCVNDSYRKKKSGWSIKKGLDEYSVGAYAFYEFIAPRIIDLASMVGVQYVYLFCADDGSTDLIRYYTDVLHFDIMDDMACVRPEYDSSLDCMTAKISKIETHRNRFLDMDKLSEIMDFINENGTISVQQARSKFGVKDPVYLFERIIQNKMATLDSIDYKGLPVRIKKL